MRVTRSMILSESVLDDAVVVVFVDSYIGTGIFVSLSYIIHRNVTLLDIRARIG